MATSNPIIVEKDIYDLLNDGGYFDDWSAYYGLMPDSDDDLENDVICINASSGLGVDTNQFQRPNFQILVRSKDYYEGRVKAQELLEYLMNFGECTQLSFVKNGHNYILAFPWQTAPEHLGYDEKHRALFSINFNAIVEHLDMETTTSFLVDAGRFNNIWSYSNPRTWYFPSGTVLHSDGATSIESSTDQEVDVDILEDNSIVYVVNDTDQGVSNLYDIGSREFMIFKCSAGRFNFSWNNPSGRLWTFPTGTVLHSDGTTPISTSTDVQPDVIIPVGGGFVILESDSFSGNYQLKDNYTDAVYIGDLSDIDVSYYLDLYNCPNITGDLSNLPPLSYFLDLRYCTNITGALPVPTASTFRAYKIYLSGCTGIAVADSIVNMASYWNGKTAPSGAVLNFGTLQAEYDVTTEVAQLTTAGFSVTYTPYS